MATGKYILIIFFVLFCFPVFADEEIVIPASVSIKETTKIEYELSNGKAQLDDWNFGTLVEKNIEGKTYLCSAYPIKATFKVYSNSPTQFMVTQHLQSPLTGEVTQATLPESVFLCKGIPSNDGRGTVLILQPTAVSILTEQPLYKSNANASPGTYVFEYVYWIDGSYGNLTPGFTSDRYTSIIVFSVTEMF